MEPKFRYPYLVLYYCTYDQCPLQELLDDTYSLYVLYYTTYLYLQSEARMAKIYIWCRRMVISTMHFSVIR